MFILDVYQFQINQDLTLCLANSKLFCFQMVNGGAGVFATTGKLAFILVIIAKRESDIPCMSSPLQKHEDLLLALARNIVEFLC